MFHIHDGQYRNIKNIYPDGEESFAYNSRNQKIKITDKLGNETRLSYDNRGNLTGVINPLGTKLSITYESHASRSRHRRRQRLRRQGALLL